MPTPLPRGTGVVEAPTQNHADVACLCKFLGSFLNKAVLNPFGLQLRRVRDEFRFLAVLAPQTILDIGGNTGEFARLARHRAPEAVIYSFEPLPSAFRVLKRRSERDPKLEAFPLALGDEEMIAFLHESAFSPSSSLLEMTEVHTRAFPGTEVVRRHCVTVTTLDAWAEKRLLQPDIFVKIDVQGYEDRVIRGGMRTLARAKGVLVEVSFVPLYHKQCSFETLWQAMRDLGFSFAGMLNTTYDRNTGAPLQADALFSRH